MSRLPQSEADEEIAALARSWVLTPLERRELESWGCPLEQAKRHALFIGVVLVAPKIAAGRVLPDQWQLEAKLEARAYVTGEDLEAVEAATDVYAAAEHGGYKHVRALDSLDRHLSSGDGSGLALGGVLTESGDIHDASDEADVKIDTAYFEVLSAEVIGQVRALASRQQRQVLDLVLSGAFSSYRAVGVHLRMKNPLQAAVQMERLVAKARDHFERIAHDAA